MKMEREQRLRRIVVLVFGGLYLLSYAATNLVQCLMTLGYLYAAGVSRDVAYMFGPLLCSLPLLVLGALMLLSVFHRWAFHALAIYVLATQVFCVTSTLTALEISLGWIFLLMLSFLGDTNMLLSSLWGIPTLKALLNLILWLLPFFVYYALRLHARKRGGTAQPRKERNPANPKPAIAEVTIGTKGHIIRTEESEEG
jgi:hypothetical protein